MAEKALTAVIQEPYIQGISMRSVIDHPVDLRTSDIWMKPLFQSVAKSIGCDAQLIRMVSSRRCSRKAAKMQRPPGA